MLVCAARAAGMPYEDLRLISIHIYAFSLSPRSGLCCAFCFSEVENEKDKMIGFHVLKPYTTCGTTLYTQYRDLPYYRTATKCWHLPLSLLVLILPLLCPREEAIAGGSSTRGTFVVNGVAAGPRPP